MKREENYILSKEEEDEFCLILNYLEDYPDKCALIRKGCSPEKARKSIKDNTLQVKLKQKFAKGRKLNSPEPPKTKDDEVVLDILINYFGHGDKSREELSNIHKDAMGAENFVGFLLEYFLFKKLKDHKWVWCSGSIVRSVDFIKFDKSVPVKFLQVKNRDNSENSSSQSVRDGTKIEKWFRCFSKKAGDNWSEFPEKGIEGLDEASFRRFVRNYCKERLEQLPIIKSSQCIQNAPHL